MRGLALAEPQERAIRHRSGPLLLTGEAGTGKTEVLARRFESLVAEGTAPDRILVLASTRATAQRLRERVEQLLDRPLEELWIGTWDQLCERLLREHSTAAGLDPFFDVLGPAERLALLLDHIDELPLRNQQIRGNPAGLLTRLLEQIDEVKTGSDPPDPELAELIAAHDRLLADTCSLDRGDVYLALNKLLGERPDVRAAIAHRFEYLMVDELEDTTTAQRAILAGLREDNPNQLYALDLGGDEEGVSEWVLGFSPGGGAALDESAGRETGRRARSDTPSSSLVVTVELDAAVSRPANAFLALCERAGTGSGRSARDRAPAGRRDQARGDLRACRRPCEGRTCGGRDGRARDSVSPLRASGSVPTTRGQGRDRLVASAGRSGRLGGSGASA